MLKSFSAMANPVLTREIRGRWRRPVTYIILFAYVSILALLMGFIYSANVIGVNMADENASSLLGRKLFANFFGLQTGVWMLLSAALTAPAIAGERERGLLQGMLLSPITPGAVVRGKLVSSLWFIGLLLVVPMPIVSLCFTLGGLSPGEFLISFLLIGSTALSGACLGLATSACNRRSDAALMTSFLITLTLCWPPVLVALTFDRDFFVAGAVLCIIYQAILTAASLGVAADAVNSVLPERENAYSYNLNSFDQFTFGLSDTTSHASSPVHSNIISEREAPSKASIRGDDTPRKIWRDTRLSLKVNFKNPVMQREVRARLRRRAVASQGGYDSQGVDLIVAIIAVPLFLGTAALSLGKGPQLGVFWLLGAMVISAVIGALTFVREREQQTLQPLLLTLLSPTDVLMGKMGAACFAGAFYSSAFLPVVLLGALSNLLLPLLILLLGATAIWCGAGLGLIFSWICRQAGVAVAASLAATFVLFAISENTASNFLQSNIAVPLAFDRLQFNTPNLSPTMTYPSLYYFAVPLAITWFLIGAGALFFVGLQLHPKTLEKDGGLFWRRDFTKEH